MPDYPVCPGPLFADPATIRPAVRRDAPATSLPAARAARDEGIARAEAGASGEWKEAAYEAVRRTCQRQREFIVDDVWVALGGYRPDEGRAMGAVIQQAARDGLCERTECFRPSAQPKCHANPRRVWRSKVYAAKAGRL